MILTNTLTKKALEHIIKDFFSKFGIFYTCVMLDSLKFLGFYYATKAGLSITIEDLKTPDAKQDILDETHNYIDAISQDWYEGKLSETERFQSIIDQWNLATESLKNKIVDYYKIFDPVNNLYIMAFSGARGNMSQVRQLIGMRGLMSDQEGNIIDLPIQSNFREGLTSLDYLISAYGARKGVVDTALKTADSGYLTRRLIYVAQDLIIREVDCQTKNGIFIDLQRNPNGNNLIGRYLLSCFENNNQFEDLLDKVIDEKSLNRLYKVKNIQIKVRSCLTCASSFSLCQKCYGWDLAKSNIISLGEAVGIVAAQSIGEPGTQLTMRTFHTGGIYTSELLHQNLAPFSGKLVFPEILRSFRCRTSHGVIARKTQQESKIKIINWQGKEKTIVIPLNSFLYKTKAAFVKKGELISEASLNQSKLGLKRLKSLYSPIEGEIFFHGLRTQSAFTQEFKRVQLSHAGSFWIRSGKLFTIPLASQFKEFPSTLSKEKSLSRLRIISPFGGIFKLEKSGVTILGKKGKMEVLFEKLTFPILTKNNITVRINTTYKNNQFADIFSVLAYIYFLPKDAAKIYSYESFKTETLKEMTRSFFCVMETDVWNISLDELRKKYQNLELDSILKSNRKISRNLISKESGLLLEKDGLNLTLQKMYPIFVNGGTLLNCKNGDFVSKNDILAYSITYRQQTEDIVQGLPKVEDLIEARAPKNSRFLIPFPTVVIKSFQSIKEKERLITIQSKERLKTRSNKYKYKHTFAISSKNYFRKYNLKFGPKIKKSHKVAIRRDEFINPFYCAISMDSEYGPELVRRNINENYLAKKMGFSRRKLITQHGHLGIADLSEGVTPGSINSHDLLYCLNLVQKKRIGLVKGTILSLNKFQLILVNSIQAIYTSQGVDISNKHIEIIVRQMTAKAKIQGIFEEMPFYKQEIVKLALVLEIAKLLKKKKHRKQLEFRPILLSSTATSLTKPGFLAPAGFQETKRVLSRAALEGHKDWLRGLKECIITGRLIPAGSAFLNYKNYLDTIYFYKDIDSFEDVESFKGKLEDINSKESF